jgi:hypothetical protein
VRVVIGTDSQKLARPYDVNLWEATPEHRGPQSVISPIDPSTAGIDPLTYL